MIETFLVRDELEGGVLERSLDIAEVLWGMEGDKRIKKVTAG